jgi:hypothetical protein
VWSRGKLGDFSEIKVVVIPAAGLSIGPANVLSVAEEHPPLGVRDPKLKIVIKYVTAGKYSL